RQPVLSSSRIDPDDPQPPEIALLSSASDEGVLERRVDRLLCRAIQLALVRVIALRQTQQLLALGPSDGSSLDPWHRCLLACCSFQRSAVSVQPIHNFTTHDSELYFELSPSSCPSPVCYLYGNMRASFAASAGATSVVPLSARFRFVVFELRMCCLNALLRRNFPRLVRLNRLAAPRCVFSFGISRPSLF